MNNESNSEVESAIKCWEDIKSNNKYSNQILRGIYGYGFETPSEIQKLSIQPMLSSKDMIAQAQSGTGKTGSFTIGSLYNIDYDLNQTQCIILETTRELAIQTYNVFIKLSQYVPNNSCELCIGGVDINENIKQIEKVPKVIIGCPGRVLDLIKRNILNTNHLKVLVFDEADELLSYGFKDQIYNIFKYLPNDVQICLYSATLPNEIIELSNKFMRDPIEIYVKSENLTLEGISQYIIKLENDNQKYLTLKDIFSSISVNQTIIYCNSVNRVSYLYNSLLNDGFSVCCIHSNMNKQERTNVFNRFKSGNYRVLISSNVTARGIDIQQVSVVINFDLPKCEHTYLHRIGRSGRWGRKGMAINFIIKKDIYFLNKIEKHYNIKINELPGDWMNKI